MAYCQYTTITMFKLRRARLGARTAAAGRAQLELEPHLCGMRPPRHFGGPRTAALVVTVSVEFTSLPLKLEGYRALAAI